MQRIAFVFAWPLESFSSFRRRWPIQPFKNTSKQVFFEVTLYFCRRDRQNLRVLKASNFKISIDAKAKGQNKQHADELTKNHRENARRSGRKRGKSSQMEVLFVRLPLSKNISTLKLNELLFQRAKKNVSDYDDVCSTGDDIACGRTFPRRENEKHLKRMKPVNYLRTASSLTCVYMENSQLS